MPRRLLLWPEACGLWPESYPNDGLTLPDIPFPRGMT